MPTRLQRVLVDRLSILAERALNPFSKVDRPWEV
jgi:hypothetical protein